MNVDLLPHQWDFLASEKKYCLLLGGIGSGKTWAGVFYIVTMASKYPKALGFIGTNTYKQLRNTTMAAVFKELSEMKIPFSYNQNSGILEILGAKILCASLENYDSLRGIEIGYGWLDETAYARREAWEVLLGRLRDRNGPLQIRLTTTPKGFNWLYDYFEGELKTDEFETIKASSYNNPFLPDGYLDSLSTQYDPELVKQELGGEFVNVRAGRIYYGFSREINLRELPHNKDYPIWVGMDFNISPMTATIGQAYKDNIYIIDEFYLKNSNTFDMALAIKKKYGTDHVTIVPDSTGKKTTTNSNKSDHTILKEAGFQVKSATNPFRIDRYNCVNGLLSKGKITIDPKCKYLIKDLEQLGYKEGTDKPDDSDKSLSHISDALGYLAWRIFPLKTKVGGITIKARH